MGFSEVIGLGTHAAGLVPLREEEEPPGVRVRREKAM